MGEDELQRYLHEHIPLSRAMEVTVESVSEEEITLRAPLAPNINHRDTLFGGSASAIAILAAWSLVHTRLCAEGITTRIVIQRNTMRYDLPVDGGFTARSFLEADADWARFVFMLRTRGGARIQVAAEIIHNGKTAGRLDGQFVALIRSLPGATP